MPRLSRAASRSLRCPTCPGTGVQVALESVSSFRRIGCPVCRGIGVHLGVEYAGYCIGDLNESNILVQRTALLTIVDTDSFQVPNPAGPPYLCPVGKPEYTAPESQGKNLQHLRLHEQHDRFALAVLLFLILQEGSHPFRGIGPPSELGERVRSGLFPFVPGSVVQPPPLALFGELAPPLPDFFRAAFEAGHANPGLRPSAKDWSKALAQGESRLILCQVNPQHHYYGGRTHCTWCARTNDLGRDPFPAPAGTGRTRPVQPRPPAVRPAAPILSPTTPRAARRPAPQPLARGRRSGRRVGVAASSVLALLGRVGRSLRSLPPRRTVGIFTLLTVLILGPVLYHQWSLAKAERAARLVSQAREALERGNEAAASEALDQLAMQAPELVAEFSRDRADRYRTLARRATPCATELRDLALTEAGLWDAKVQDPTGTQPPVDKGEEQADATLLRRRTKAPPTKDSKPARLIQVRSGPIAAITRDMVAIPGGTFQMGCDPGDRQCSELSRPPHQVKVRSFRMGRYEVTQSQWQAIMKNNPAQFQGYDRPIKLGFLFHLEQLRITLLCAATRQEYRKRPLSQGACQFFLGYWWAWRCQEATQWPGQKPTFKAPGGYWTTSCSSGGRPRLRPKRSWKWSRSSRALRRECSIFQAALSKWVAALAMIAAKITNSRRTRLRLAPSV